MQSNIIVEPYSEISRHTVPIRDESDVYAAVGLGRKMTTEMGFAPGAQACAQTIIAELARNALRHAGGGTVELCALKSPSLGGQETRRGLEIIVQDRGPGIPDVSRALEGTPAPVIASRSPESSEGAAKQSPGARPAVSPAPAQAGPASLSGARASGAGLGVGLASAQRLADEFTIDSVVGSGTRIRALKWDSPDPEDHRSVGARPPRPLSRRNK
jgi:serine/threonine-protein kinase RsbT